MGEFKPVMSEQSVDMSEPYIGNSASTIERPLRYVGSIPPEADFSIIT